jgi:hypothetical protein
LPKAYQYKHSSIWHNLRFTYCCSGLNLFVATLTAIPNSPTVELMPLLVLGIHYGAFGKYLLCVKAESLRIAVWWKFAVGRKCEKAAPTIELMPLLIQVCTFGAFGKFLIWVKAESLRIAVWWKFAVGAKSKKRHLLWS